MQTIQSQKPFQFSFSSLIPNLRLPERGASFLALIIGATVLFEAFNYSTTEHALGGVMGGLKFLGIAWSTILALAFCGIDFAGIARLFSPEDRSEDGRMEGIYLLAAWLLAGSDQRRNDLVGDDRRAPGAAGARQRTGLPAGSHPLRPDPRCRSGLVDPNPADRHTDNVGRENRREEIFSRSEKILPCSSAGFSLRPCGGHRAAVHRRPVLNRPSFSKPTSPDSGKTDPGKF